MKLLVPNPKRQKKRLAWLLLLFFISASVPVYYLLQTVYTRLENEAYFTMRTQAETFIDRLEQTLKDLLEKEQQRPIAEYQFFNVMANPLLLETTALKFSPLSEMPPKTEIKGLVGYFQINTDGSFHLPALPETGQDNLSGLSLAELEQRLKLKHKLRQLLSDVTEPGHKTNAEGVLNARLTRTQTNQQKTTVDYLPYMAAFMQPQKNQQDNVQEEASKVTKRVKKENKGLQIAPSKTNKKKADYKTRKETVQLPDQTMASRIFNQSNRRSRTLAAQYLQTRPAQSRQQLGDSQVLKPAIDVFSFESEVTPLQLIMIGRQYFCFYRYVWHDNKRYTQGFIVNSDKFLNDLIHSIPASVYSSLVFFYRGDLLKKIELDPVAKEDPLYQRNLSQPFQNLSLVVNAGEITQMTGGWLVDLLGLSIYSIFVIGLFSFYRLGSRHIDLAKQQQDFISAVSHELKTPLTSIRMYSEMLRANWLSDETKKQQYYDFIFFESERLSRLISNVLQLARLGQSHQSAKTVAVSAESLFASTVEKIAAQIEAADFELNRVDASDIDEQVNVEIDQDAFFQMVINLIDNAIKFSKNTARKQIDMGCRLSKNRKSVIFFIRDYGPGVKADQMKRIFQLFYRGGDELTRTTPGTGIGLALVAQLAEKMGASVKVINKQPGSEFQIKITVF